MCFPLVFLLSRPPFLACLRQFLPIFRISTPRPDDSWIVLGTQQGTLGQGPAPNLQTGSWSRWSVPGSRGLPLAHRPLKQKPCVSHRETDLARCRRSRHGGPSRPPAGEVDGAPGASSRPLIACCVVSRIRVWGGMLAPQCDVPGKPRSALGV